MPKTIFLSYKYTGENVDELTETLGKILSTLRSVGHTVYCTIEDEKWLKENHKTNKQILDHALGLLDKSDVLLAFVRSNEKSEGMLLEIGYMMAKGKRFSLAIKRGIKTTFLTELAEPLIKFDLIEDLNEKLRTADF